MLLRYRVYLKLRPKRYKYCLIFSGRGQKHLSPPSPGAFPFSLSFGEIRMHRSVNQHLDKYGFSYEEAVVTNLPRGIAGLYWPKTLRYPGNCSYRPSDMRSKLWGNLVGCSSDTELEAYGNLLQGQKHTSAFESEITSVLVYRLGKGHVILHSPLESPTSQICLCMPKSLSQGPLLHQIKTSFLRKEF